MFLVDRAKETTTTTGTGSVTLGGAVANFITLASLIPLNTYFYYVIALGTEWEVGKGYLSGSTTLVRDAVIASSTGTALVSFSAGSKEVWIDFPAQALVELTHQQSDAYRSPISW